MNVPETVVWLGWSVWFATATWRFRPVVARDPRGGATPMPSPRERWAGAGSSVARRVPALALVDPRLISGCIVTTLPLLALAGPLALVLPVTVLALGRWAGRRRAEHRRRRFVDQLADAVEMLRVATSSGLTVGRAIEATHRHAPAGRDADLGFVVDRVRRGEVLDLAVTGWVERNGPPADELAALVRSADRSGAAIGGGLQRLAVELRRRRRVDAETRARRLPVTMLGPLVVCVLPAFGLVTVVPMIVVGIADLGG